MKNTISLFEIFHMNDEEIENFKIKYNFESDNKIDLLVLISKKLADEDEMLNFDKRIVRNYFFDEFVRKYSFVEAMAKIYELDMISNNLDKKICHLSQVDIDKVEVFDAVTYDEINFKNDKIVTLFKRCYLESTVRKYILNWFYENSNNIYKWKIHYDKNPPKDFYTGLPIQIELVEKYINEEIEKRRKIESKSFITPERRQRSAVILDVYSDDDVPDLVESDEGRSIILTSQQRRVENSAPINSTYRNLPENYQQRQRNLVRNGLGNIIDYFRSSDNQFPSHVNEMNEYIGNAATQRNVDFFDELNVGVRNNAQQVNYQMVYPRQTIQSDRLVTDYPQRETLSTSENNQSINANQNSSPPISYSQIVRNIINENSNRYRIDEMEMSTSNSAIQSFTIPHIQFNTSPNVTSPKVTSPNVTSPNVRTILHVQRQQNNELSFNVEPYSQLRSYPVGYQVFSDESSDEENDSDEESNSDES